MPDDTQRIRVQLGFSIRSERRRRRLTLREVGAIAGVDHSTVHYVEVGRPASLEVVERIVRALRLRLEVTIVDPRRRELGARSIDPVHSAMGEIMAAHFQGLGFGVGVDEPFQHYQHAGRADIVVWSLEPAMLLHIENKTEFPDLQAALGSFNVKRAYLGEELAERLGVRRWLSETHVIAGLWSADVLHVVRLRTASLRGACPDPATHWAEWWAGTPPVSGRHSSMIVWDPLEGTRRDRDRWVSLEEIGGVRPRYRDYRDSLQALRNARLA